MADEKRNMRHDVAVATGFVRGFVRHLVKGDQPPESGEPQEPSAPGEPQAQEPSAPGETEAHEPPAPGEAQAVEKEHPALEPSPAAPSAPEAEVPPVESLPAEEPVVEPPSAGTMETDVEPVAEAKPVVEAEHLTEAKPVAPVGPEPPPSADAREPVPVIDEPAPVADNMALDEPPAPAEAPTPLPADGGRRDRGRRLLIAGAATLTVGVVVLVAALTWAGGGTTVTSASTTSTELNLGTAPGATFPSIVGGDETTGTPSVTGPSSETTSSETTGTATATPGANVAGQNDARLRSLAGELGFTVFALEDPAWQLDQLTSGQTPSAAYVAMVYRKGLQYVSVSQEPREQAPTVPNSERVTVHGIDASLVDMESVVLLSWLEQGTAVTVSTDVSRAEALALADRLRPIAR